MTLGTDYMPAWMIQTMVNEGKLMKTTTKEEKELIEKTLNKFRFNINKEKEVKS